MPMNPVAPQVVVDTIAKHDGNQSFDGWEELWQKGSDFTPWDRGTPHPALEDALLQQRAIIGAPTTTDVQGNLLRKKALVPGCGRGVDVLLLASFGYDAYGLEYSASAVEHCKQEEARNGDKYPVRDAEVGRGKIVFVQGDFFQNQWLEGLGLSLNCFDLIYDYTFFCALNPSMRPDWALRHSQLLAPSPRGNLICLEFPRHKDPSKQGPPWGVSSDAYMEHLSHPGEKIPYDTNGRCKSDPLRETSENGLERVCYLEPARTHEVGKDADGNIQDRVSIWRHK